MTNITFHGGVREIGGNKILVEHKDTRIFLDFGMQMGEASKYYSEFLNPRKLNGMDDLIEFGLLPDIPGIYRKDYSRHTGRDDVDMENRVDAVILSHAHVDHCEYIKYLRPDIPVYCTEGTKLILQAFDVTGSGKEYLTYKETFKLYLNKKGSISKAERDDNREIIPRTVHVMENLKKIKIDSIDITPVPIDHSLPGVCALMISTPEHTIGYTADIRFHGRKTEDSEKFVEVCGNEKPDYLLCEGTRIDKIGSMTESDIEYWAQKIMERTKDLVVTTFPQRDLDRLLSFYNATKKAGRKLAVDLKQAYLLQLFDETLKERNIFPSLKDDNIRVYIPRKYWGLKTTENEREAVLKDYDNWQKDFIYHSNSIDYRDIKEQQKEYVFCCSDFALSEFIDIKPKKGTSDYIRSSTEPFDIEMELDQKRVRRWLSKFGLVSDKAVEEPGLINTLHVSGHGTREQIEKLIEGGNPDTVIPIHTTNENWFYKMHKKIRSAEQGKPMSL